MQSKIPSVLLVDLERDTREALARALRERGWIVSTADRYALAVHLTSGAAPDHLVVEQPLPDGCAFALFSRLRQLNPRLTAVMVTRQPSVPRAVRAIRVGFADYRPKGSARDLDIAALEAALRPSAGPENEPPAPPISLARVEWDHIQSVLTRSRGNVSKAARILGLHRRSLQRRLRREQLAPA
jgi:two-component system response regulator RegA